MLDLGDLTTRLQYSDETAKALAEELLAGAGAETTIAVVSAPSVFVQLKNILVELALTPCLPLSLFLPSY